MRGRNVFFPAVFLAASFHGFAEEEMIIGPRQEAPRVDAPKKSVAPAAQPELIARSLGDAAARIEAEKIARKLSAYTPDNPAVAEIAAALKRDPNRYAALFATLLDPAKYREDVRFGALRAFQIAPPDSAASGRALADSLIAEPATALRKIDVDLIQSRKDHTAGAELLRYWRNAFNEDNGFNEAARAAAVNAMGAIGDRQVLEGLIYYVTIEVRAESASASRIDTVAIRGNRINLPIDLPSANVMGFQATIVVPAVSSLQQATGEHFGRNLDKWNEWLAQQPDFKNKE